MEKVVFGGGCFWCTEAIFKMLKGVKSVRPGYAGGQSGAPTYEAVVTGQTGHAEVVQIEFDPKLIKFEDLLTVFFATHDPTTPNRQGNDVGSQYRSIVLFTTEAQKMATERFIADLNQSSTAGKPIVTEVKPLEQFFAAEPEHLDYYARNKFAPYCQIVINPKLEKVQANFAALVQA